MKGKRFIIYGIVQGVGFRPFVKRLADELNISGSVCNHGPFVEIRAFGEKKALFAFEERLKLSKPERAVIEKMETSFFDSDRIPEKFIIDESLRTESGNNIFIPPDIAICDDCKKELFDKNNRRYLHPFINCTQCGPRLSILENLPYDRERTSMKYFKMCAVCESEYYDKSGRRFDAQPVCCKSCGPLVYLLDASGNKIISDGGAFTRARRIIKNGGVIAVKGIGGFHLVCDASSETAVEELRKGKHRPSKPFAVMMKDMDTVRRECTDISHEQEKLLDGPEKPIVLLERSDRGKLAESVAPGNPRTGVMLPYTPVHLLLFSYPDDVKDFPDVLVMTSGNISGAPICRTEEEAVIKLSGIADAFLSNDREILTRADDSVTDHFEGKPYMIRRSRGYAPLPVRVNSLRDDKCIAAFGGELKNTFCIGKGKLLYPSSYIGDLSDAHSTDVLNDTMERFIKMLDAVPRAACCDLHPAYLSVRAAENFAEERGIPLFKIQHHYAHILSCMAENDRKEPVIGLAFDGTGYGTDGSIWGGEILACDMLEFRRLGHITSFKLAGGDTAAREGWRAAYAMLKDAGMDCEAEVILGDVKDKLPVISAMLEKNVNCAISTSAGRLFDAVATLLGVKACSSFEGEAAMALQFAAERYLNGKGEVPSLKEICEDTGDIFKLLALQKLEGMDSCMLAYAFHEMLSDWAAENAYRAGVSEGMDTVALSGGCFQNTLFLKLVKEKIKKRGMKVLVHSMIPVNDGGIAPGQAYHAACKML